MRFACLFAVLVGCGFGDNSHSHHTDDGAVETGNPVCGNGTKESGEGCDDGNTADGDGCTAMCELQGLCGNGTIDGDEACDDHNTASGDGCSPTCQQVRARWCRKRAAAAPHPPAI